MKTIKSLFIIIFVCFTNNIIAQPTIQSFSPSSAKPGDTVVIAGTNYSTTISNNIVFFGSVKAVVTSATAINLSVIVPVGATYAPITVLNTSTSLITSSVQMFNPIFSPVKTSITSADFATKQDFATGTGTNSIALGDLDGDNKIDMVSSNQTNNNISVLRNISSTASINFNTKQDFTTGSTPFGVVIFDLDGDGKLEIVVANLGSGSISVFRNTSTIGSISFATKVDFTVGNSPRSITVGDVDLDGKMDIAVTNQNVNTVSLLRNTSSIGNINFATKIEFSTGTRPTCAIFNDIDGDLKTDLIVANQNSNNVSIFRNTSTIGNISFSTKIDIAANTGAIAVSGGDIDGDNKIDLVVANLSSNNIAILKNTSTIGAISFDPKLNFSTGLNPISISIGDIDGNRKPDISVANYGTNANSVSFFVNNTNSSTISLGSKVDFPTGSTPTSVAVADINGDNRLDILTANNGSGVNTISVLRNIFVPSSNANLSALAISSGTLTPTFNANTTEYTINVPSNTTTFTVTPTAADANATIRVNFNNGSYTTLASGSTSVPNTLRVGQNTIEVRVTAEDGTTVKSYAIFINKPASTDANLSALTISVGTLSPVFDANTTTYTATVLSSNGVVTVTPTSNEPNASIRVNVNGGTYFTTSNGSASTGLVLNNGNNTINVLVTAQDGTTTKTYSITVNKPTDIADLLGLSITNGTLSPTFSGGITNYTISLPNTTSGIIIRPTALIFSSTIRYNLNGGTFININSGANSSVIPINTGANTINIQVTAADGVTVKTYIITVTRALSSNANLSNIVLSTGSLSSAFNGTTITSYTALLLNSTTSITFTPTRADAGATIQYKINGGSLIAINSGTPSATIPISLTESNIIEIVVTAQDGITTKTYTVNAIRQSNDANLSNLTISAGSLTPVFASNVTEYSVNSVVSNSVSTVTITPTASNTNATISVRSWSGILGAGEPIGTSSFTTSNGVISLPLILVGNSTVIEVQVTAQDGSVSKLYNIRVVRAPSNNANLTALSLTTGTLSPVFSTNTTTYTANVSNSTTSIRVNFTREIFNSVVNVRQSGGSYVSYAVTGGGSQQTGQFNLSIGTNQIELLVVAQDGVTTKLYTINIIRAGSPNPDLSNLVLSVGSLSPAFSSGNISYTATVPFTTSFMTFTATTADASTTIKYGMNGAIDQNIVSGIQSPNLQLEISLGLNLLQITVSNGGNAPFKTYTVRIIRTGYSPSISSISPLSAKPGDVVTINGTNFRDANMNDVIVYFGATKATVSSISPTQITTTVPTGATHAPITVLNTFLALSGTSSQKFNPIYAPAKPSISSSDFAPRVNLDLNRRRPTSVAVGDIDGDGKPDMAVTAYYEVLPFLTLYRNTSSNGSISFDPKIEIGTAETPTFVTMGDIDGDGKLDLAVLCLNKISILLNTSTNGTISFAPKQDITIGSNATSLAIGDIDGDGRPEIVIGHNWNFMFSVIRNTTPNNIVGSISFSGPIPFTTNFNYKSVTLADIDGDKKLDVVTSDFSVRLNTSTIGQITFAPMTRIVDAVADKVITSDIDGDGKLDVIGNGAVVYRNTSREGAVNFERTLRYPTTYGSGSSIDVGDMDGDGKPDLILTSFTGSTNITNTVEILKNISTNGIVHFAAPVSISTGRKPVALAVNDLDGDGKPDIITVNEDDNNVSVFRNAEALLPIILSKFTAIKQNNTALLQWSSASEINAKQYEIEYSINELQYNKIGTIASKGIASNYQFSHSLQNLAQASMLYYRLKMIDNDGSFSYSKVQSIYVQQMFTSILLYPNPVKNYLHITAENVREIKIIDAVGKIVLKKLSIQNNTTSNVLEMSHLKSGVYFVEIVNQNGQKSIKQIIKE